MSKHSLRLLLTAMSVFLSVASSPLFALDYPIVYGWDISNSYSSEETTYKEPRKIIKGNDGTFIGTTFTEYSWNDVIDEPNVVCYSSSAADKCPLVNYPDQAAVDVKYLL